MVSKSKVLDEGKYAVLKFPVGGIPSSAQAGHVFAFGPRDNVAFLARQIATWARDITRRGFPTAVWVGSFRTPEEAAKLHNYQEL
jgi:hypothetical protein